MLIANAEKNSSLTMRFKCKLFIDDCKRFGYGLQRKVKGSGFPACRLAGKSNVCISRLSV
jgi:hypothetical protein